MSYILDALKKSEQQRPPGPVPDLFTVHGPQARLSPPRWPARAIVVVALLLLVPAIALWAWIAGGRRNEGSARPPAAASSQPRAEAGPERGSVAAPTPQAQVQAQAGVAASVRGSVEKRLPAPASPAQKPRATVAAALPKPATEASPAPVPSVPAQVPTAPLSIPPAAAAVSTAAPAAGEVPSASTPASPPPAASAASAVPAAPAGPAAPPEPAAAVTASEAVPPADGRVLNLAELPQSIRAELPPLLVSGHVWSEDPALRLLSVDDRLLHEGGEATPGVSLQEVTAGGAVFTYKGWRFRVAGGRQ